MEAHDTSPWGSSSPTATLAPSAAMRLADAGVDSALRANGARTRNITNAPSHRPTGATAAIDDSHALAGPATVVWSTRSEEHTSELQSLMRNSYAVFCLKKKKTQKHAEKAKK